MSLIKNFTEISKTDTLIAGGKGASLGEMMQAGIPVPPGFVILSGAFDEFTKATGLGIDIDAILGKVIIKEPDAAENASKKIQAMILAERIPENMENEILASFHKLDAEFVAVRSSATSEDSASAAWAGQLDSFLNTTEKTLLENVKKCWASLFTPRAIFYRFEKELHQTKISVAVVVQKMVESEKSGIAFSVHPVTQDRNQIIIEAGYGLGEAIVSGSVTPDSYVVGKQAFDILEINVQDQSKALYRKTGGGNEWRELGGKGKEQVLTKDEIVELAKLIAKIESHYDFPCDIEWAEEAGRLYIVQSRPITTLGKVAPEESLKKFILGNQDVDTSFASLEMVWKGFSDPRLHELIGVPVFDSFLEIKKGKTINYFISERESKPFFNRCTELMIEGDEALADLKSDTEKIARRMQETARSAYRRVDQLSDPEIIDLLRDIHFLQSECSYFGVAIAFADVFGGITNRLIDIVNKRTGLAYSTHTYTSVLATPQAESLTEEACTDIENSAETSVELLEEYFWLNQGYIGRGLTEEELDKVKTEKGQAVERFPDYQALLSELNLDEQEKRLFRISQDIIYAKALRADSRQFLYVVLNRIIDRLSKRWSVAPELLETLPVSEICSILSGQKSIPADLAKRREHSVVIISAGGDYGFTLDPSADDFLKKYLFKEEIKDKENINGQVAQAGKATGRVKLVFGPQHNGKVQAGDILVSTATSPQLLPAMKRAAAFVTDVGGITSHAAIVARELKKPCIVGTKHATQLLRDGDLAEVDADHGVVRILKQDG